ncbi:cupin domain-containing protein [Hoyosella rhizosphaerae]|uniref:Cupin type-2 domain-containing protein n=1 Tax=Hoyosella rhizosphaerae TaxID=1755582 RepID=A0A916UKI3_9ACTN|nr:cupin domain-containing protein [Hoyosella rhizosphaerae]MBN4928350.1 cupin domain-containing protein [Hoyosella rhizosphaerae]GGC74293.1 hypothetical protein GCM10011410_29430 [Hoyosella rhizosphaerae]
MSKPNGTSDNPPLFEYVIADPLSAATPRPKGPGAAVIVDTEFTKVVAFTFGPGQELREHAVHHPGIITAIDGTFEFTLPDRTVDLQPGQVVHLAPLVPHSVRSVGGGTLTVAMLLPHS